MNMFRTVPPIAVFLLVAVIAVASRIGRRQPGAEPSLEATRGESSIARRESTEAPDEPPARPCGTEAAATRRLEPLSPFPLEDSGSALLPTPSPRASLLRAYDADRTLVDSDAQTRRLLKGRLTQEFRETPLPEVVSLVQELTQVDLMIDRRRIEDPESLLLTWNVADLSIEEFLDGIGSRFQLGWRIDEGVVVLTLPCYVPERRGDNSLEVAEAAERLSRQDELLSRTVALRGDDLPPKAVAELLAMSLHVPWNTEDIDLENPRLFSFDGTESTAQTVVLTLRKAGIATIYRDGVLWFVLATR